MKESIKRATNNAKKEDLLKLLETIKQLADVRRQIDSKFDEIIEVLKKSRYRDDNDPVMQKFLLLKALMTRSSKDFNDIKELVNSMEDIIKKEADD